VFETQLHEDAVRDVGSGRTFTSMQFTLKTEKRSGTEWVQMFGVIAREAHKVRIPSAPANPSRSAPRPTQLRAATFPQRVIRTFDVRGRGFDFLSSEERRLASTSGRTFTIRDEADLDDQNQSSEMRPPTAIRNRFERRSATMNRGEPDASGSRRTSFRGANAPECETRANRPVGPASHSEPPVSSSL
jgi:hypothetical protein